MTYTVVGRVEPRDDKPTPLYAPPPPPTCRVIGQLQQVDDSRDEENVLDMAKAMATTERLVAESRRHIRMEKQITPTWRRVPEAVGPVRANSDSLGGMSYATSVGPTSLSIDGGHGISGSSSSEKPLGSFHEIINPVRGEAGESILSLTGEHGLAPVSGRQVITAASIMEEMLSSPSGENASDMSGTGGSALSLSADPQPSFVSAPQVVEGGSVVEGLFSLAGAGADASEPGGAVRGPLLRQNVHSGADGAPSC